MLDDLERRAKDGRLWVGSDLDVHKYEAERDAANLKVLKASEEEIDFLLPGLDPATVGSLPLRYDAPLTIICDVPAGWTKAWVRCMRHLLGEKMASFEVPVKDGRAVFDIPRGWFGVSVRKAD